MGPKSTSKQNKNRKENGTEVNKQAKQKNKNKNKKNGTEVNKQAKQKTKQKENRTEVNKQPKQRGIKEWLCRDAKAPSTHVIL